MLLVVIAVVVIISVVAGFMIWLRAPSPLPKKAVIYASLSEMTTADPSTEFSNSVMWLPLVYETLVWYDPFKDQFIPGLAERWESDPEGTVWTFYIRKGAKFHDGSPVNAEAVAFSINRTILLGGGAAYIWDPVERIEVIDEYTIRLYLKYPAPLLKIAASPYSAYIFCPNVVKYANATDSVDPKVAEWFNRGNACGSGPYKLIKWDPEFEVVLEKWEEWWGWREPDYPWRSSIDKAPDVFIIKVIKDAATQSRMLRAGEIHIAQYIPIEDLELFERDPNFVVVRKPSFQNLIMLINTRKPPLNDTRVRRAIAHAIPYEDIVKLARGGLARVASGPIPYGLWGHFDNLTYTYDLDLAKRLLAEAGYPDGIPRTLTLVYTAGDIYEARTAEIIKASLAKIGINVEIKPMSWEEQWALAQKGWETPEEVQDLFIFYWWPDVLSPITYLYNMFHSESKAFNLCYYENQTFDAIIIEAYRLEGLNPAKALELYYKAQYILYMDVPAVPLWDMIDIRVATTRIKNLDEAINPCYPTVIFAQKLVVE
ncbi:MAG: ABC transporter substrate-binding protein [Candidatus Nezhaarchaeales archaeon]